MANTLYVMDAAAIFLGDADPTAAEIVTIKSVKIPAITEKQKDHSGGGASMDLKLGMRVIEALELTFKLEGFNPKAMSQLMPITGQVKYTIRGNVRDVAANTDIGVRAIVNGRMVKYEPGEVTRDSGIESDYMISEVVGYQLFLDDVEKYYFDYFAGPLGVRVDGAQVFRTQARNLGLV